MTNIPEQEASVSDILTSIRQILSHKMNEEGTAGASPVEIEDVVLSQPMSANETDMQNQSEAENIILLTPQMQVVEQTNVAPSLEPSVPKTDVSGISIQEIKPFVQEWLDRNLPEIVERIVSEEVRHIFNKR